MGRRIITAATLVAALGLTAAGCGDWGSSSGSYYGTVTPPVAGQGTLEVLAGNNQQGNPGDVLTDDLVFRAVDPQGQPVSGITVTLNLTVGNGSLSSSVAPTTSDGIVSTRLTLGAAGPHTVEASAPGYTSITARATCGTPPATPTYDVDIEPILASACTTCHSAGGAFPATPLTSYDEVTQGVSVQGGGNLVVAGNANASFLVAKTDTGGSMAGHLTPVQALTIRDWVDGGAPRGSTPGNPTLGAASGDGQSGVVGTALPDPFVVLARDAQGNPQPGVVVDFAILSGGGTLSQPQATTDANGEASVVLTLGATSGANGVEATAAGHGSVQFGATATPIPSGPPTYLADVRSILQAKCVTCHAPGQVKADVPLTNYNQVRNGNSAANGNPLVVPGDSAASILVSKTGPTGSMAAYLNTAEATVIRDWVDGGALEGNAGAPANVARSGGNNQTGVAGTDLSARFRVVVTNASGTPVSGVSVTWTVTAGGGTLTPATSTTNANGHARSLLTLGPAAGMQTVEASVAGLPAVRFTATAVAAYSGEPLASSSHPLDVAAIQPLQARSIEPAGLSDARTFLRRVSIDLIGRYPTEAELAAFEADTASGRRNRAVNRLLASREFADHWAKEIIGPWLGMPNVVRERNSTRTVDFGTGLADFLEADRPLRALVNDLSRGVGVVGDGFFTRYDLRAYYERMDPLINTFTGMSVDCARCHDHKLTGNRDDPKWTQRDAYGLYAFFAENNQQARRIDLAGVRFGNPIQPRFVVDGYSSAPSGLPTLSDPIGVRRRAFADELKTSEAFQRGTSHRIWSEIAAPLLDPDEFLADNLRAVRNKPLLAALQDEFVASDTRLKRFLRRVMRSRLYQLSSERADRRADPFQGRYRLTRLHAEVLDRGTRAVAGVPYGNGSNVFRLRFGAPTGRERIRKEHVSLGQALALLNGGDAAPGLVRRNNSDLNTLASQVDSGAMTFNEAATLIVRRALTRNPTSAELTAIGTLRGASGSTLEALQDVAVVVGASADAVYRR